MFIIIARISNLQCTALRAGHQVLLQVDVVPLHLVTGYCRGGAGGASGGAGGASGGGNGETRGGG